MFKLLVQATGRALQLMLKATSKEKSKRRLLRAFMQQQMLLPTFAGAWKSCTRDLAPAKAAAMKQSVLQQLQETGMQQAHT